MSNSPNEIKLPRRSKKYGVGKEIGGNVYLHFSYEQLLGDQVRTAKARLPIGFEYTVVKINLLKNAVTFIYSPDFDTSHEPKVGAHILVREDGSSQSRKPLDDPYIYHHKWLFVADDYAAFDVEESKRRSTMWLALDNVDKSRIGRASYWNENVVPRLKSNEEQWFKSAEIRKLLKLSTCELAHKRDAGELEFKKNGNAYLYKPPSDQS